VSEYQYVTFRAIDAPVSKADLAFMRNQSSRAEVTPWSFRNEYHFGDFHGATAKMLRRGYDIHLHYANFGIRKLCVRLPHGLPDSETASSYFEDESFDIEYDDRGNGGILTIAPYHEPGDLDELWDIEPMFERLIPLREEIMQGDLRPLYLAHLVIGMDCNHDPEEWIEGPVPAGLANLTDAQHALAEYYSIDKEVLAAAAEASDPLRAGDDTGNPYVQWLGGQPAATKDAWLAAWMDGSDISIRRKILAQFKSEQPADSRWPTAKSSRTMAQLLARAEQIHADLKRKADARAARKRAGLLAKMAENPAPYLDKSEQLIKGRSGDTYRKAAQLLADLREAVANTGQKDLAEKQARKLKDKNPTLHLLTRALRDKGFIPR